MRSGLIQIQREAHSTNRVWAIEDGQHSLKFGMVTFYRLVSGRIIATILGIGPPPTWWPLTVSLRTVMVLVLSQEVYGASL